MAMRLYPPERQVHLWSEDLQLSMQKPIGFPDQNSEVRRVGPLFYWSWATTDKEGGIDLHPHKGFEIMTYVIEGQVAHGDTLGTQSIVGAGGVQVMQTGSGVSHKESMIGKHIEAFQIWFEPYLKDAYTRQPAIASSKTLNFQYQRPEVFR